MGMLLILMTIGGLAAAGILLAIAMITGKNWLRNFVFGGVVVWVVFYAVMLFGFSLFSTEKTLAMNEPKEYCGFYFDCHIHTAVTDVRKTKTIGDKTANGEFYIVTVKVFSDARAATLGLSSLSLFALDDDGRHYQRVTDAENPAPPFTQKVPAGGSFEKEIIFDLPLDVKNPRMDARSDGGVIEKILVGNEDSILHKRSYFKLTEQTETAASNER